VDNGSDPEAVTQLCASHGATPVLLAENRGFAAGVNAGWRAVSDRPPLPLLLLNPDADLTPEALDALLAALPGHDGVGPLLLEGPDRPQVGVGGAALTLRSVAASFLLLSRLIPSWRGLLLTRGQARRGGDVAWVCMAALLLAPDALERFGPLPEDEVVYAEDVAWGTAASARGARFAVVPEAVVGHPHGSSGGSAAWVGALERLCRRRLGPLRGPVAVRVIRLGLAVRRAVGRGQRTEAWAR
jgi:GT2 family glycosyltransferase